MKIAFRTGALLGVCLSILASPAWPQSAMTRSNTQATVNADIAANGVGAITGPILNTVLNDMINSVLFGASDLGTGVLTALGVNVGSPGSFVVNGGVLGTPLSGILTNTTGLPLSTGVVGTLPIANGGTGGTTYTAGLPLLGGSSTFTQGTISGGTTAFVTADGSLISGHCPQIDVFGGLVDSGSACGSGGSSGLVVGTTTITSGTNGRIEYNNSGKLGELATTGSGSVVLATSPTLVTPVLGTPSSGNASNLTNIPVANATGTLTVPHGGTGATSLTAGDPVIANGTSAFTVGTFTGSTTTVATASGTLTSGHCVSIDGSGNFVDAGGSCTTGGGGGTVASSTIGQIPVYTGATTVTGTTTGTGVVTALGVNVGSAGAFIVNGGALGTPSSGTMTNLSGTPSAIGLANGTGLPISTGVSGLGTGVATALAIAVDTNGGAALQSGAITTNHCLKWGPGVADAGASCAAANFYALATVSGGP